MTSYAFPYVPGPFSGDWSVELPGDASIGEVLVYAESVVAPVSGWLAYRAAVLALSPRYFLTFENSADRLEDQSPNGNDFTLVVGTPDFSDVLGPAGAPRLQPDGPTDRMELPSDTWMNANGQTVAYWIKSPSGVPNQGSVLARDGGGTNRYWITYKDSDDDWAAYSNNSTGPIFSTVADICDDQWHMVVWTWNWASGVRTGAMYVDGVLDTSQTSIGLISSGAQEIQLGANDVQNTRTDLEIALVAQWDTILSAGDVSDLYDTMGI